MHTMKTKIIKKKIQIGQEELAALTLLRSSGVGVLAAAQVAGAVIARMSSRAVPAVGDLLTQCLQVGMRGCMR